MISSIWYKNPLILFYYPYDYFPNNTMTTHEMLNSIMRLSMYICVILLCLDKIEKGLFIVCVTAILTYLLDAMNKESIEISKSENIRPTVDNPFMNIQLHEYSGTKDKMKKRKIQKVYDKTYEDHKVKADISNKFKMSRDSTAFNFDTVDNVFGRNTSERQFYTVPVTSIPSNQDQFARWVYGLKGPTCKENNSAC